MLQTKSGTVTKQASYLDVSFDIDTKDVDTDTGVFSGYGSVFNGKPDDYGDIVLPGAFSQTLSSGGRNGNGVALLWQHDTRIPIGVWEEMAEDKRGLKLTGRLTQGVRQADEALLLLKAGAIRGLSIGYRVVDSAYDKDKELRYLKSIELWEVSLVTFPANTRAQVTKVKAIEQASNPRELERALRDAGLSCNAAKIVVSRCRSHFKQKDSEREASKSSVEEVLTALKAESTKLTLNRLFS
jgi:hypothetical protein